MKIEAYIKHLGWKVPVSLLDMKYKEVEVDLSGGQGDTSEYRFDEVELFFSKETSDGYHTFEELYYHRMMLFNIICKVYKSLAWKSWKHDDGSMYENSFIVGIETNKGHYTYHFNKDHWDLFDVKELEFSPKWDGHTSEDITRLLSLINES